MVAFARFPCPRTLSPEFIPIRRAMGPFTMMRGAVKQVLHRIPCSVKSGSSAASSAASRTGTYSGLQPASTALIATFSTVHSA